MYQKGQPKQGEGVDLTYWADHTLLMIERNMDFRGVYPLGRPGPYYRFRATNEKRKRKNKWYSTTHGFQELYARVYNAANGNTEKIIFFWTKYLAFADMGVGRYRPLEKVTERSVNAKWNKQQPQFKWGEPTDVEGGKTFTHKKGTNSRRSRPNIKMEIRHQVRRLQFSMLPEYYGRLVEINMLPSVELKDASDAIRMTFIEDKGGKLI